MVFPGPAQLSRVDRCGLPDGKLLLRVSGGLAGEVLWATQLIRGLDLAPLGRGLLDHSLGSGHGAGWVGTLLWPSRPSLVSGCSPQHAPSLLPHHLPGGCMGNADES